MVFLLFSKDFKVLKQQSSIAHFLDFVNGFIWLSIGKYVFDNQIFWRKLEILWYTKLVIFYGK